MNAAIFSVKNPSKKAVLHQEDSLLIPAIPNPQRPTAGSASKPPQASLNNPYTLLPVCFRWSAH